MLIDPNTTTDRVYEPGDWICWKDQSGITVAEIVYIRQSSQYPYDIRLITNKGSCPTGEVLECRTREGLVMR